MGIDAAIDYGDTHTNSIEPRFPGQCSVGPLCGIIQARGNRAVGRNIGYVGLVGSIDDVGGLHGGGNCIDKARTPF
jgi:hypothetical protein